MHFTGTYVAFICNDCAIINRRLVLYRYDIKCRSVLSVGKTHKMFKIITKYQIILDGKCSLCWSRSNEFGLIVQNLITQKSKL
jgi:hypothetical protein